MARFIFNQVVKHETSIYEPGDISNISDKTAEYFASNGWGHIEGKEDETYPEPILDPKLKPSQSKDIIPENPYDTVLDIQSGVIGTEDTNNG